MKSETIIVEYDHPTHGKDVTLYVPFTKIHSINVSGKEILKDKEAKEGDFFTFRVTRTNAWLVPLIEEQEQYAITRLYMKLINDGVKKHISDGCSGR